MPKKCKLVTGSGLTSKSYRAHQTFWNESGLNNPRNSDLRKLIVTMSEKVKEVALEEFEQAKVLTRDAVRSGAYLYPIKVQLQCFTREGGEMLMDSRALPTSSHIAACGSR
jgi:hypothetical protein